ncbi:MAG: MBL fold metallo-hydrolase [Pseudomonadota bacterium]
MSPQSTGPDVHGFFDPATNTISYVVVDPATGQCAIIDSVLDFDAAAGTTSTESTDALLKFVIDNDFKVCWILETHVHADHLSAAPYLRDLTEAPIGIGSEIITVQRLFGKIFNAGSEFELDGSQFDTLFNDQAEFSIGDIDGYVLHTPGHTPACVTYVIGDCAFTGDTAFMPDFGTARTDFPGGDAAQLYHSINRILSLPEETRLFVCHDYKAPDRNEFAWETSVAEQRERNVHIKQGTTCDEFVKFRTEKDRGLPVPKLLIPSVQVNMRAGNLPPPEADGNVYLKIPMNRLK